MVVDADGRASDPHVTRPQGVPRALPTAAEAARGESPGTLLPSLADQRDHTAAPR